MANQQTVADLRAVLTAHGFKEAQAQMDGVKKKAVGTASGLKSLTDVMNKANTATTNTAKGQKQFSKGTNKINQAANQASFGIQDFLLVIGNQGLGGALRSASNNAAQMAFILGSGGMGGAIAGLGLTIASLIPDLFRMGSSGKKAAEEVKEAVDRMAESVDNAMARMRHAINLADQARERAKGIRDVKGMRPGRAKAKRVFEGIDKAEGDIQSAQQTIAEIRRRRAAFVQQEGAAGGPAALDLADADRALRTIGVSAAASILEKSKFFKPEIQDPRARKEMARREALTMDARRQLGEKPFEGAVMFGEKPEVEKEFRRGLGEFNKELDKMQAKLFDAQQRLKDFRDQEEGAVKGEREAERRKQLEDQAKAGEKAREQAKKEAEAFQREWDKAQKDVVRAAERAAKETVKANKAAAKEAEDANKQRIKALDKEKAALMGVLEQIDPLAAKLMKIDEQFMETGQTLAAGALSRNPFDLVGAAVSGFGLAGLAAASARGEAAKKKPAKTPGISGTFGVADFARQLQNALLKDNTAKQTAQNTKQTANNTKGITSQLNTINSSISNLKNLQGTFGP